MRRLIHKRIRHESLNAPVVADVNAPAAVNVGANRHGNSDNDREGSMKKSEGRRATEAPPEERVEEAGRETSGRAAPIDEDVAGELNAALPEHELDGGSDEAGGSRAA